MYCLAHLLRLNGAYMKSNHMMVYAPLIIAHKKGITPFGYKSTTESSLSHCCLTKDC